MRWTPGYSVSLAPSLSGAHLGAPRPRRQLVLAVLAIPALVALVLLLASSQSPSTPSLAPHSPGIASPSRPSLGLNAPGFPSGPSLPHVSNPGLPGVGLPEASLPDLGFGGGGGSDAEEGPEEPIGPQTFHHLTINHILHSHIDWLFDWPLICLVALLFLAAHRLARHNPPRRPRTAALLTVGLIALCGASVIAGLHQVPGPGTYVSHPIEVVGEKEDDAGNRTIEEEKRIDHYRPPLDASVAWLLAAAGLMELATPSARTLVTEARRRRRERLAAARKRRPPPAVRI